jgi:AcrR family transcriptional regulator
VKLTTVKSSAIETIILAAVDVVRRDGPAGLTMRAVAAELGVTATALYRHVAEKDELRDLVVARLYQQFLATISVPLPAISPDAWLQVAADRYLRYALEYPNDYRLLFSETHGKIDIYPGDFQDGGARGFRMLRDVVASAIDAGVLAGHVDDAGDIALTVFAHMHGLVMLHLAGRFGGDDAGFSAFYHDSLGRVLRGLGSR